jgi:hypothetical protein
MLSWWSWDTSRIRSGPQSTVPAENDHLNVRTKVRLLKVTAPAHATVGYGFQTADPGCLANLETVEDDLDAGAVVVLTDESVRIRRLPIG